jgi:hypothetical protein
MAEKKTKSKTKREIPLRSGGEAVDVSLHRPSALLFQEVKRLEDLSSEKNNQVTISTDKKLGTQQSPDINQLGTQPKKIGNPTGEELGTQLNKVGFPTDLELGTQTKEIGNPTIKKLGTKAPNEENWAPNSQNTLGTNQPKNKKLGTQQLKTTEEYRRYEKARPTTSLHIRAESSIVKRAQHFIIENKKEVPTMRDFFELAATKLMDEFGNPTISELGTNPPLDDRRLKMLYKSRPFIINLYLRYNSVFNELSSAGGKKWTARWSPRDDESAVRYNDVPAAILELGILQTQIQKGFGSSRIQTFKYYTDEIEKVLASGVSDEMLDTILKYHRQLRKNQTGREVDLEFLQNES